MADRRFVTVDDGYLFPTPLEARLGAKIATAKTDAITDSTTKYGALPAKVTTVEEKTAPLGVGDEDRVEWLFKNGKMPGQIDPDGRWIIYDPVFPNGFEGPGGGVAVTSWHMFLVCGQSNVSGRAKPFGPELDPADPRIQQYGATRRVIETATVPLDMHDTALGLSPATVFAREYLKAQPSNVGVLLIPAGHGGTAFTPAGPTAGLTWSKGMATNPANALYELSVVQAQEALAAAGSQASLKGVIWHQGEGNGALSTTEYAACLDALIADYRTDLGAPSLPFVVGQMNIDGMTPTKLNTDKAHVETPKRILRTGFAPAIAGGSNYNDTTHLGRPGVEALGRTYLSGLWQAISNTVDSRPLPPQDLRASFVGGTLTAAWEAPPCRATGYRLEYSIDGGTWTAATRAWPMYLAESVTGLTGTAVRVRVTTLHDTYESVTRTITAGA